MHCTVYQIIGGQNSSFNNLYNLVFCSFGFSFGKSGIQKPTGSLDGHSHINLTNYVLLMYKEDPQKNTRSAFLLVALRAPRSRTLGRCDIAS